MTYPIYDRENRKMTEVEQYRADTLHFLYDTRIGRILLASYFSLPFYSKLHARSLNTRRSVKMIDPFIKRYDIRMADFEQREFSSFNDFFTRKARPEARPVDMSKEALIAVADAKLAAYPIQDALCVRVKNSVYTVNELTRDREMAERFLGGYCLVFRLSVDDCHRYLFPDDGSTLKSNQIRGRLHTVSPISDRRHRVFVENQRVVSRLSLSNLGEAVQIEVGAIQVGKIHNHMIDTFRKGEEKGYFSFGGSTVILLLEKDKVRIDADILAASKSAIETQVRMGEKIGVIQHA
jgi:phosphatidylserine decarboxylase